MSHVIKCAQHRTGKLCGQCKEGFSDSLMSTACIPDTKCDDWWVWPLGIILALAYLMWYMYKGSCGKIGIDGILKLYSFACQKQKHPASKAEEKVSVDEETTPISVNTKTKYENAYFDNVVYFLNIISLIKVQVELHTSDTQGIFYGFEKYFIKYLDVDVQQTFSVDICPFAGIDATSMTLARPIFTLMVLVVWCVIFSFTLVIMQILSYTKHNALKPFKLKLVEGYVQTVKYSYSGVAKATFLFLTCINVGDQSVWKYNAEISCYSLLQTIVVIFAAFYTVPFVLISPLCGKLLRVKAVSSTEVMLACIFPFPFVLLWGIWYVLQNRSSKRQVHSASHSFEESSSAEYLTTSLSEEAQVLLDTYQGAFKDKYSYWEGIIEFRKLIFCSFYLIPNNIHRLVF